MQGLPTELLLVLLLGLALLFNFVMQRAVRGRQAEAAQDEPAQEEIPEEVWRAQSAAYLPPLATDEPARRPAEAPAEAPADSAQRPRRRFARQTLLGSRRQVQDAFVVATILGRCRGDEPHEIR
jgi:hypothetical protein